MLTDAKIRYVRETLKEQEEVATKELLQSGIDNNDIMKLKKIGIIESFKWGHYKLGDAFKYYDEGIKAIAEKDYDKAKEMFIQSINSRINVMEATYYLFLISVFKNNLDDAFNYFDVLYKNENDIISKCDLNFYLYIISYYNSIPSEYYKMVRNMKLEDTLGEVKIYSISKGVKEKFFRGKSFDARDEINVSEGFNGFVNYYMLSKVLDAFRTETKQILSLIKDRKYSELCDYYEDIYYYRDLSAYEKICKFLVDKIINIMKSGVVPIVKNVRENDFNAALNNGNYKRALELNRDFNINRKVDINSSHLYLLLVAINEIIDNIDKVREDIKISKSKNSYSKLVEYLMNGQIDEFTNELKIYFSNIKKSEYLFLIMNLVKIDSILEDKMYSNTMLKLSMIVSDNFSFDMSEYVMSFYENLALKRFDVASIYLSIIENAKSNGLGNLYIDGLRKIFDKKVKTSGQLFSGVTEELEVERAKYTFSDLNIQYTMEDLINNKVLMLDKDVDREHIRNIVNDLTDVVCFEIAIDGEVRMMLKYKDKSEEEGVNLVIKMR